jgi:hypothetical protein
MDQDTREAFATLSGQLSGIRDDAQTAAARATEAAAGVGKLNARVDGLERAVFGDGPPAASVPVVKRLSDGEFEQDALTARVIRIEAEMGEQTKMLKAIFDVIVGTAKNPMVQRAAKLALAALIGWLTFKQTGLHLPQVLP